MEYEGLCCRRALLYSINQSRQTGQDFLFAFPVAVFPVVNNAADQIRHFLLSIAAVSKREKFRDTIARSTVPTISTLGYPCKSTLFGDPWCCSLFAKVTEISENLPLQYNSYTCHCGIMLMLTSRRDTTCGRRSWNVRNSQERKPPNACLANIA